MSSNFETGMFSLDVFNALPNQRDKDRKAVEGLLHHLEEVYNIKASDGFASRLLETHYCTSSALFNMSYRTVETIYDACCSWKRFLRNSKDFDQLVCNQLVAMVQAHVSVLSVYFIEKDGIELVEDKPAASYAIVVNRNGDVQELR